MSFNAIVNGVSFTIPSQGDSFQWGTGLSGWVNAITNGVLQKAGGNFTLTAEVNFGPTFGLNSVYYKLNSSANLSLGANNAVASNTGFDAANNKLVNLATPTFSTDGANKAYVDESTGGQGISVLAYGADPTGIVDATTAFQNAANAAGLISTYITLPSNATFVLSNTISNINQNWLGIKGGSIGSSTINCAALPVNVNAFQITNASVGFEMSGFTLQGPGQSGNLSSGLVFISPSSGIADQINLHDIEVNGFSANGLWMNNPIVSTFARLRLQLIGENGAVIVPHPSNANDGGTSTSWVDCYVNNCLCANSGAGYNFNFHQYFTLTGCAADSCANSYYYNNCTGFTELGCGNESNITTGSSNGISVTLNNCSGFVIAGHRTYNLPSTDSVVVNVLGGHSGTIEGMVYTPNSVEPNNEVVTTGTDITIRNADSSSKTGQRAIVLDNGANTEITWGSQYFSYVNLNSTANAQDPGIIFANTNAATGNQIGYILRRWSTIGPNGSLVIGNTGGGELFTVTDTSKNGSASYIQTIDPLNSSNGRLAFGTSGASLDYNNLTVGSFQFTRDIKVSGNSTALSHRDTYSNNGISTGGTFDVNCASTTYKDVMLCGNPTLVFQNAAVFGIETRLTLYVRQSSNGSNTITWGNTIWWSDNNVPVLSTHANTADMFTFVTFDAGLIWLGTQVMGNVPNANSWF